MGERKPRMSRRIENLAGRIPLPRAVLNVLISVSATGAVAFGGLVAEDVTGPSDATWLRGALAALFLLLLTSSVYVRSVRNRTVGTLYYVRYLEEWMGDWHTEAEEQAEKDHLDARSVTRTLTHGTECVVDMAADIHEIATSLQQTMNDDDTSTGFRIAPNLLVPAALALGYQLHPRSGTQLLEHGSPTLAWTLAPCGVLQYGAPFKTVELRSSGGTPGKAVGTVLITCDLTPVGATTLPVDLMVDVRLHIGAFLADASVTDSDPAAPTRAVEVSAVPPDATRGSDAAVVHPEAATDMVVSTIRRTLHDFPEATIYLALRMPKTVALSVGYRLSGPAAQHHECPKEKQWACPDRHMSCRYPWSRLVPLLADQDFPPNCGRYRPARVHHGQPAPEQIEAAASATGLRMERPASTPARRGAGEP